MPVYLLHGFRWHRIKIRHHVIRYNIDDAAPEWLMAPATSIALLQSFYTLYDFLPPLNLPPLSDPLPSGSATSESTSEPSMPNLEMALSFNEWSVVKLLEQYDPNLEVVSQPYAYVADYVVKVQLGAAITDEVLKYEAKLRSEQEPLSTAPTARTPVAPASGASGDLGSTGLSAGSPEMASGWFEKLRDVLQKDEDIGWFVVVCGDEERSFPSKDSEHHLSDSDSDED